MLLSSSGGVQFAVDDIGTADIYVFEEAPVDDQPLDIGTEDLGTEQVEFCFKDVQTGDAVWLDHTDDSTSEEYFPNDESVEEYAPVDENGEPLPWGAWFRGGIEVSPERDVEVWAVDPSTTEAPIDVDSYLEDDFSLEDPYVYVLPPDSGEYEFPSDENVYSYDPEFNFPPPDVDPQYVNTGVVYRNFESVENTDEVTGEIPQFPVDETVNSELNPDVMFYSMAGGELTNPGDEEGPTDESLDLNPTDLAIEDGPTSGELPVDEMVNGELNPEVIFYSMAGGELPLTANAPGADGGDIATEAPVEEPLYGPMVPTNVSVDSPVEQPVDSGLDPDVIFQSAVGGGRGTDENGNIQPNFRGNQTANEDRLATALLSKQERVAQRAQQQEARQLATQTRRAARAARRASRLASR